MLGDARVQLAGDSPLALPHCASLALDILQAQGKGFTTSLLWIWVGLEKTCVSQRRFNICAVFFPFHATTFLDSVLIEPSNSHCLGMRSIPSGAIKGFLLELRS